MTITKVSAAGDASKIGESRATINTPAVTIVAAWIKADTGVGPSIASGSHVCSRNCADLPIAPINKSKQVIVAAFQSTPMKCTFIAAISGTRAKTASYETEPVSTNTKKIPSAKPKSPTRLTINAFIAAAFAVGFWNQNPIKRYDANPTPSHPKNICTRLSDVTNINIAKVNSDKYAKNRGRFGSSCI